MVIDITDVGIPTINLRKNYDTTRFLKGKKIYEGERVHIREVEDTSSGKDKSFEIKATVRGQRDRYDVELKLKNTILENWSCTCPDEGSNYCKHILATCLEVADPHGPNTDAKKREELDRLVEYQKQMALEREERMRKVKEKEEYQRKYGVALNIIDNYKGYGENNKLNIDTIYERAKLQRESGTTDTELTTNITLEPRISYSYNDLSVSFKIGASKMYILKDIEEFAQAFENGSVMEIGKNLKFIAKKESFVKEDHELIDYILNYSQVLKYQEALNRNYYRYSSAKEKSMLVIKDRIDEFFKILKSKTIYIEDRDSSYYYHTAEYIPYAFSDKTVCPKIHLKVDENKDVSLKSDLSGYEYISARDNIYLLKKREIYTVQKTSALENLLKTFSNSDKIVIPSDKVQEFSTYVMPKWEKYLENTSDNLASDERKQALLTNKLASKIYLDVDDKDNITLRLTFCYNNAEFNVLAKNYEEYIKENGVLRNIQDEENVLSRVFSDGFEILPGKDYFVLSNLDDTYEFLTTKIEQYMNDFEVLVTEKLKGKSFRKPKIYNIGVRIENNLLELDMSGVDLDMDEIKNVLQNYTLKKKYYKLKNGDLLDLSQSEDLEVLSDISNNLDVDFSKLNKNDKTIKLPVNRSLYLERMLSGKGIEVTKDDGYTAIINNIGDKNFSENIKVRDEFNSVLRNYQKTGYKWLKVLEHYGFGGILADDMGLGKTLQVISVIGSYIAENENRIPSIVVCPSSLVLNWKAEFEKWCPSARLLIPCGSAKMRETMISEFGVSDVIITSYDLLKRDTQLYEGKSFKYIIADEAQYIKNSSTQNASALKELAGEVKFALTGTPIENSVAELWSIFDYIMPNYLYNYNKFKKKFEQPIVRDGDEVALKKLKQMIEPFVLRRIKTEVLTELPEKNVTVMKNEMTSEQAKLYLSYMAQVKSEVAEELNANGFAKSKFKILMLLTRLRQICCHPSLFIEDYYGGSGKFTQCMEVLNDAIEAGHKVLLFSQYTSMFDIIEEHLKKQNINYYKLTGQTPVSQRVDMVESFNKDENVKVFLISLKAGGTGLNLVGADVVMHYDPWWNLSSENQATDRAYRIGQKNSVQVYKFITTNSIEEKIHALQEKKAKLSQDILSTEEKFINTLSKEEVMALFE